MKTKLKNPHAQALGRKGGKNTLKKHGKAHFREMARLSWIGRKSGDKSGLAKQAKAV